MSEQNTLPQGSRAGTYRVERVRHIGRYTIDYDARDDDGRTVLLREFYPADYSRREGVEAHARDPEDRGPLRWWLRSFLDRWQAAARVQPAGLVRVLAVLEANATAYVALEPFPGEDLNSLLQHRGRLAERELRIAFAPLAETVAALHAAGVAPVDLGPETVCVAADGHAVLTDIGSLRAPIRLKSGWLMTTAQPPFAAPEQLRPGSHAAAASDSYALGALLLTALTGAPPPDREGQPWPDLDSLGSPPLAAAIRSALAAEPAQRPDAAALVEVLGGGGRPIAAALRPAPSSSRSAPLKFAVVAGIVALLAVGVFYFLHSRAKPTATPAPTASTKAPASTLAASRSVPRPAASAHRAAPTPAVSLDQLALDLLKKQQELRAQQQAAAEAKRKAEAKKPAEQSSQTSSAAAIAAAKAAAAAEAQRKQQALEAEVRRLQEQLKARQQAEQQAAAQKAQQAAAEQAKQKAAEEQARLEAEARHIREVAAKAMKDCAIPAPKLSVNNNLIYDTALQVPGARKLSSGAIRLPPVRLADGTTEQFDITPDSCAHRVRY